MQRELKKKLPSQTSIEQILYYNIQMKWLLNEKNQQNDYKALNDRLQFARHNNVVLQLIKHINTNLV